MKNVTINTLFANVDISLKATLIYKRWMCYEDRLVCVRVCLWDGCIIIHHHVSSYWSHKSKDPRAASKILTMLRRFSSDSWLLTGWRRMDLVILPPALWFLLAWTAKQLVKVIILWLAVAQASVVQDFSESSSRNLRVGMEGGRLLLLLLAAKLCKISAREWLLRPPPVVVAPALWRVVLLPLRDRRWGGAEWFIVMPLLLWYGVSTAPVLDQRDNVPFAVETLIGDSTDEGETSREASSDEPRRACRRRLCG